MNSKILEHYLKFSTYTYPGCYKSFLKALPDSIAELGNLICHQVIHRVTLREKNTGNNIDMRYGDMSRFPWHRLRCDDDVLMTAVSMIAELLRLDPRGFKKDRAVEHKIVVTCRYVSVLMASVLKTKGIPARCRAGFSPYCLPGENSADHWINQYWSQSDDRWVTIDADGFFENLGFSQFDIPDEKFDWAAKAWLDIRSGKTSGHCFVYADGLGTNGLKAVIRAVFYDFHALMNNEISYNFQPMYIENKFDHLGEDEFKEIDRLAEQLLDVENNFDALLKTWDTSRKFRWLNSPLIGDSSH